MADSVYTIDLDNSPAKAAMNELTKGVHVYGETLDKVTKEAEKGQKRAVAAKKELLKVFRELASVGSDANRKSVLQAAEVADKSKEQAKALKEVVNTFKLLADAHGRYTDELRKYGYEQQANDLAKLQGQLKGFVATKEEQIILGKKELELKKNLARYAVTSSTEGKLLAQRNAAVKALIDSEEKLLAIRAQSAAKVKANLIDTLNLQNKLRGEVDAATASSKLHADAEIKLAEAKVKSSNQMLVMIKQTNELEERTKHLTMTRSQAASTAAREYRMLLVLQKQLGRKTSMEIGDSVLKDYAKLQIMANKFYDTNDKGLKDLLEKFKKISAEAKKGFRTGKGTSDYIAQLQVLVERMNAVQVEAAQTAVGLNKVDKAAHRTAKGIGVLNISAALSRNIFDAMGRHISVYAGGFFGVAAAAYGTVRAIKQVVAAGSEFTGSMQRAGAVMGATAQQISAMSEITRDLAARTVFTASEAAEALVQLGMAGLSVQESITALEPTLKLASIGMLDFGKTADYVTNIMQGFQLTASQVPRIVDVLAAAVTSSNATVDQMANSMSYAAPVAQSFGISLEAVAASMEVLHNAGIKSSRAGTGMRRVLLKLYSPSVKGAQALDKLGVSMVNGEGKTRSFIKIMKDLAAAVEAGKGNIEDLVDIVGVRAAPAFLQLVKASGSASDALTTFYEANLLAAGSADTMQKTIEDFIGADWKKLIAAAEEVGLQLFDLVKKDLRQGLQDLTAAILSLTKNDKALEDLASALKNVGQAVLWLGGALLASGLVRTIGLIVKGFASINQGVKAVAIALGGPALLRGISGLLGFGAAAKSVDKVTDSLSKTTKVSKALSAGLKTGIKGLGLFASRLGVVGAAAGVAAIYFADDLADGITAVIDAGKNILGIKDVIDEVKISAVGLKEELAGITAPEITAGDAARTVIKKKDDSNELLREKLISAKENLDVSKKQVKVLEQQEKAFEALAAKSKHFKLTLYGIQKELKAAADRQKDWNEQTELLGATIISNVVKQQAAQKVLLQQQIIDMEQQIARLRKSAGEAFAIGDIAGYEGFMQAIEQGGAVIQGWKGQVETVDATVLQLGGHIEDLTSGLGHVGTEFKDVAANAEKVRDMLDITPLALLKSDLQEKEKEVALIKEAHKLMEQGAKFDELSAEHQRRYLLDAEAVREFLDDRVKLLDKIAAKEKKANKPAKDYKKELEERQALLRKFEQVQESAARKAIAPEQQLLAVLEEKKTLYKDITTLLKITAEDESLWADAKKLLTDQVSRYNVVLSEELSLRKKISSAQKASKKELDNYAKSVSKGYAATLMYNKHIGDLQQLLITMPQYTRDWVEEMERLHKEMVTGSMNEFQKKLVEFGDSFDNLDAAAAGWLDNLSDNLTDFIVDGEADFKGFFDGIVRDLTKMSARKMIFDVGMIFDKVTGGTIFGGLKEALEGAQDPVVKVAVESRNIQEQMLGELKRVSGSAGGTSGIGSLAEDIADNFIQYQGAAGGLSELFSTSSFLDPKVTKDFAAATKEFQSAGASMQSAAMLAEQTAEFGAMGLALTMQALGAAGGGGVLGALAEAGTTGTGIMDLLSTATSAISGISNLFGGGSIFSSLGSLFGGGVTAAAVPTGALLGGAGSAMGAAGVGSAATAGTFGSLGSVFSTLAPIIGPLIAVAVPFLSGLFADTDETTYIRGWSEMGRLEDTGEFSPVRLGGKSIVRSREFNQDEETGGYGVERVAYMTSAGKFAAGLHNAQFTDPAKAEALADSILLIGEIEQQIINAHVTNLEAFQEAVSQAKFQFETRDDAGWMGGLTSQLSSRMTAIATAIDADFGAVMDTVEGDIGELAVVFATLSAIFTDFKEGSGVFSGDFLSKDLSFLQVAEEFAAFADEGESTANAFARIYTDILAFSDTLDLAGQSIHDVDLSLEGLITSAEGLVEAAGGLENLNQLNTYYFENFLTAEEQRIRKLDIATKQVTRLNNQLGLTGEKAITSKDQLRGMVEGLDLTTEAGQEMYVSLVGTLAPAIIEMEGLLNSTADGVQTTTTALESFMDVLGKIGADVPQGDDLEGFARGWFQELGGEFQALIPAIEDYYQLVFSETERQKHSMESAKDVMDEFNDDLRDMGMSTITGSASLRRFVESMDLSSVESRELFTRIMMELVPAIQAFEESLAELIVKFQVLQDIAYALDIPDPSTNTSITGLQEFFALTGDEALADGLSAINESLSDLAASRDIKELEKIFGTDLPMNMGEFATQLNAVDTATAAGMDTFKEMITAFPLLKSHWADLIQEIEANIAVLDEMIGKFDDLSKSITDSINKIRGSADSLAASATSLWAAVRNSDLSYEERLDAASSLHDMIMENYDTEAAAIESAYNAKISQIESVYNEEKTRYDAIVNALKDLKRYTDGLLLGDLTPLDPGERLTESASQFQRILAAAQGGDADAMQELQGAATAYLEAARDVYASGPEYVRIFEAVMDVLQSIENPMEDPKIEYDAQIAAATAEMNASMSALKERTAAQLEELRALVEAIKAEIEAEKAAEEARLARLLETFKDLRQTLRDAFLKAGDNIVDAILDSAQDLPQEQKDLLNSTIVAMQDVQGMVEKMGDLSVDELIDSGADLEAIRASTMAFLSLYTLMEQIMPEQAALLSTIADGIWDVADALGISEQDVLTAAGITEAEIGTRPDGEDSDLAGIIDPLEIQTELLTEIRDLLSPVAESVGTDTLLLEAISTSLMAVSLATDTMKLELTEWMTTLSQGLMDITAVLTDLGTGENSLKNAIIDQGTLIATEIAGIAAANDTEITHLSGIETNVISLVERMEARSVAAQEQSQALETEMQRSSDAVQASVQAMGVSVSTSVGAAGNQITGAVNQSTQAQAEVASEVHSMAGQVSRTNGTLSSIQEQNRQILTKVGSLNTGVK